MAGFRPIQFKRDAGDLFAGFFREDGDALDFEVAAPIVAIERGQELTSDAVGTWIVESARASAAYCWARLITPEAWAAQQPPPEEEIEAAEAAEELAAPEVAADVAGAAGGEGASSSRPSRSRVKPSPPPQEDDDEEVSSEEEGGDAEDE